MNKKIYIVERGEYSDRSVRGVFSEKAQAEEYAKRIGGDAEEWEVDAKVGFVPRTLYRCWIGTRSGNQPGEIFHQAQDEDDAPKNVRSLPAKAAGTFIIVTSFVSMEHARKLAAEAYQAHLREQV